MHKPRLPLRWRHRVQRALAPRSWQGSVIQIVLAAAVLAAAIYWTGHHTALLALWTRWTS